MTASVVRLSLPSGAGYDIRIGAGITSKLGEHLARAISPRPCALIADSNVAPLYADAVANSLEEAGFAVAKFSFMAGESSKTMSSAESFHEALAEYRFSRDSVVVALGGGVTGDLAGFVASTYMRGIPFVQVPSTLLSMIDSSVGGKNAVNVGGVKNLVGNFAQPVYVSADISLLESLPAIEWRCGFAEMAKSAIIDSQDFSTWLFDASPYLLAHDPDYLRQAIAKTVEFKARVVVEDEKESSKRKCLNYGHTLGHAIEAVSESPKVLHGIAVAEGMRFAAHLAGEVIGTAPGFEEAQDSLLSALGIEPLGRTFDVDALVERMAHDKKADGKNISFVLARSPGDWRLVELAPDFIATQLKKWFSRDGR